MIDGKPFEVRMNGSVTVNDSDAYVTCAEGFGMIQPTLFMVLPHLLDGSLVEVLPDCNPKPKPISIVYPHNRHLSQKVRVFADWIAECSSRRRRWKVGRTGAGGWGNAPAARRGLWRRKWGRAGAGGRVAGHRGCCCAQPTRRGVAATSG